MVPRTHPCGAGGRAGFMGFMEFIGDRAAYRLGPLGLNWDSAALAARRERGK